MEVEKPTWPSFEETPEWPKLDKETTWPNIDEIPTWPGIDKQPNNLIMDKTEVRPAADIKDTTDKLLSKVFRDNDVFFAFSKEQIEEQKKPGIQYRVNSSMSMFYNMEKENTIYQELDKAIEEAQAIDKQLHTKEQIILRELINYECFYICDFTDAVQPLEAYGYTVKDIQPIFIKYLQKYSE